MAKSRLIAPEPPSDLAAIKLTPSVVPSTWYRIVPKKYGPLFWSRSGAYRFDSPEARWGVCYAAESVEAAFLEVWGDLIRRRRGIDWKRLDSVTAWQIEVSRPLCIELLGDSLPVLRANLQCFVGSYELSQRWGRGLMNHPMKLEGLQYLGRRCGRACIALFGDGDKPREFQRRLRTEKLGPMTHWGRLFSYAEQIQLRISNTPDLPPAPTWV